VSLGYLVAWLRIFVDRFGSTEFTFVLVLCNFICGIGAGALASRRCSAWLATRVAAPLSRYGLVELLVSATALITFAAALMPADLFGSFPYAVRDGVYEPLARVQLAKFALATLCVFVPCFFMGVTFPTLCEAFRDDARFPSLLYAWNALGAGCGVLASEFVLIPQLGHDRMFFALIGVNAALGAYFWRAGEGIATSVSGATQPPPPESAADATGRTSLGVLLACAVLAGLVAGSLVADVSERIQFLGIRTSTTMSFVAFWAVFAIFVGSALVRLLPGLRLLHQKIAYALALAVYLAISANVLAVHEWTFGLLAPAHTQDAALPLRLLFPAGMAPLLLYVGVLVFPAFLLLSLLLPWVFDRLQTQRRHLGLATGASTLAFCAGTIAFTWLAPRASIFYSLKLQLVLMAIGVALLATLSERRHLASWKPLLAAVALLAGCILTPGIFDRSYMVPDTLPAKNPIRAVRSDSSHTTFVVEDAGGDHLYLGNVGVSNASPLQRTALGLMAHIPLLAHPDPKDVLLIGYGVGSIAGAISTHETVERIDVLDLSRNVMLTAPEFADTNEGVHLDPRVRFIHDDGRNFLATTERRYDLVTSEPPPPLHSGAYRLYSREYYRDVLDHLTERGSMTQRLPVQQMPQEAVDLVIRTFLEIFPHALLFTGMREELILVGSVNPISPAQLERRFGASERVADHLDRLGVPDVVSLLTRLVQGDASLRRRYAGDLDARLVSDRHNDLDHFFLDPSNPGVVPYDPRGVLEEFADAGLASEALLRQVVIHLGRLQHHARDFPISSLTALRHEGSGGALLVDVDWEQVSRLEQDAESLLAQERLEAARDTLREALVIAAAQPKLLSKLIPLELALGEADAAIDALRRFIAMEPEDASARQQLAELLERGGRADPSLRAPGVH
jgi:spermidine synthase